MKTNTILAGDAQMMSEDYIPDGSIDFVLTSPPYDGANTPKGAAPNLYQYGFELSRVLKDGGVCVLVIQDIVHNGIKRGHSIRIPSYWIDHTKLNLWDDYIYWRGGQEGYWWKNRIRKDHDYMWIFVNNANKPKTFNKIRYSNQGSIFDYRTEKRKTNLRRHKKEKGKLYPVAFPFQLAEDMIRIFTKKDDLVLDPFCGYGTTLAAAKVLNRRYLGIELLEHVASIATKHLEAGLL